MRILLLLLCLASLLPVYPRRMLVTAYHVNPRAHRRSSPHPGTCAGPRKWLGKRIYLQGRGWYRVTDVCRSDRVDLWMPSVKHALRFGRRSYNVVTADEVRVLKHKIRAKKALQHAKLRKQRHAKKGTVPARKHRNTSAHHRRSRSR